MKMKMDTENLLNNLRKIQSNKSEKSQKEIAKNLNDKLKYEIENCNDKDEKELLRSILSMNDSEEKSLEEKLWLYNDGEFRTAKEVEDKLFYENEWKYQPNMNSKYWMLLILQFFLIPIGFLLSFQTGNFIFLIICIIVKLITLFYVIIMGNFESYNTIKTARKHNIQENDSNVLRAHSNIISSISSGIFNSISLTKHAKESFKEVTDPDKWSINV